MSLFRKQPQTTAPPPSEPRDVVRPPPPPPAARSLFDGALVEFVAIYESAKLSSDELDRVARAEELLHLLPTTATQTREIVDVTFRAFGVDRTKIVDAASNQLDALQAFVRFSHEQTQRVVDAGAKRIAELEAEIERCRQTSAQATKEGEERARKVNEVLVKVQRVLEFFGDHASSAADAGLAEDTVLSRAGDDAGPIAVKPPSPPKPAQRTSTP